MDHLRINVGEVTLHCLAEGRGPPVVLLHGFPELAYSWRKQLPALAAAGFRAVAPDLRGYGESDRPLGVENYTLEHLTEDIAGLCRSLGEKVRLVGHDWGGGIAWTLAHQHPELVEKLAILNCPHNELMKRALLRSPRQAAAVWHFFVFQLPFLPEKALAHPAFLRRALRGLSVKKEAAFSDEDLAVYEAAWKKPGAITAALAYYRAMLRTKIKLSGKIKPPTMVIWGEADKVLRKDLLKGHSEVVESLRVELIPNASHWVQQDEPDRVNELLVDFFR